MMKRLGLLILLVIAFVNVWGQEKLNGVVQIDMANTTDNNSPGITVKLNDDFLYDGKYLNHYGFGFHDFQDNSSTFQDGRNAYISGFFGIDFFTSSKNRLRINYNGNIGIGTNSPSANLHIPSDGSTIGLSNLSNSNLLIGSTTNGIGFDDNEIFKLGNDLHIGTGDMSSLRFIANRKEVMNINHSGNVGIGTSNPTSCLTTVNSTTNNNNVIAYFQNTNLNEGSALLKVSKSMSNTSYVRNAGLDLNMSDKGYITEIRSNQIYGNSLYYRIGYYGGGADGNIDQEYFRISYGGNIGIGTPSPSAKLEVAGNIKAQEIEVTLASMQDLNLNGTLAANNITVKANGNTADFVFSDDYTLKSLTEVENYIKTHKHLPDIPSADAMEKQGVNLAEMNKLLLQKVEELTLYTIEKDKEVKELKEEQKKETEELKERLAKLEALLMK